MHKFLLGLYWFLVAALCIGLSCQGHSAEIPSPVYLTEDELKVIKNNWCDYKYASDAVGTPIIALPCIHYREAGLYKGWHSFKRNKTIRNTGGPFMLDCGGKNNDEFIQNIRIFEKNVYRLYGGKSDIIPKVSDNFKFACLVAAHELRTKRHGKEWTWDSLADAVWGYNGRAKWCKQSESPYLWSDPKRGTKLISHYRKRDGSIAQFVDQRPGVMILYKELYQDIYKTPPSE